MYVCLSLCLRVGYIYIRTEGLFDQSDSRHTVSERERQLDKQKRKESETDRAYER